MLDLLKENHSSDQLHHISSSKISIGSKKLELGGIESTCMHASDWKLCCTFAWKQGPRVYHSFLEKARAGVLVLTITVNSDFGFIPF